jgi:hypothetical protein
MLAILWRLVALGVLVPFLIFPGINILALPLAGYLAFSLFAIAWRRHAHGASSE